MNVKICLRVPIVVMVAAIGFAQAGDVVLYRQGETPNPNDVARILTGGAGALPHASESAPIRTRGIRLLPDETNAAKPDPAKDVERVTAPSAAASGEASSFALQVQFPFNSAQIQPDMYAALDAVGEGIRMAGRQVRVVVEGHTDAAGSPDYNLILSRRRAEAVKQYLVSRHGIGAPNLKVVGKGKLEPLVRDNPLAPENRRVQFRPAGA
jgi:OmpA-OmpF porin, OOP family